MSPQMIKILLLALGIASVHSWSSLKSPSRLACTVRKATDNEDEGDLVTRLFKRFLPDPEEMGMKRMTIESAPEQYYATKERWADPVPGDDENAILFRQCLAQTNFEKRKVKLAYDANRDGWSSEAFHDKLDRQGPAVVFGRSESGGVFG